MQRMNPVERIQVFEREKMIDGKVDTVLQREVRFVINCIPACLLRERQIRSLNHVKRLLGRECVEILYMYIKFGNYSLFIIIRNHVNPFKTKRKAHSHNVSIRQLRSRY